MPPTPTLAFCSARAVRELRGHTGDVLCHQQSGTLLASGSADRTVRLWDLRCGEGRAQHKTSLQSFPYCLQVSSPCMLGTGLQGTAVRGGTYLRLLLFCSAHTRLNTLRSRPLPPAPHAPGPGPTAVHDCNSST